jgi:hypothetical protein
MRGCANDLNFIPLFVSSQPTHFACEDTGNGYPFTSLLEGEGLK